LILLIVPMIAGGIAIFFSFQLMKRYPVPFAGSYFYYLVFLYIFGMYSLAGSGIIVHLFSRMETGPDMMHSARFFMIFLGVPLLALSKYMLVRSVLEFLQKKVPLAFTVSYFILSVLIFIFYGVYAVELTWLDRGSYQLLISLQRWTFLGFMVLFYLSLYLVILSLSRKMTLKFEKRYIRNFGSWYLLFMIITSAVFLVAGMHPLLPFLYLFLFLSWHLIPVFFQSLFLAKYNHPAAALQDDFEVQLQTFTEKFEISKRETEVIHLICRGLTNQEIGDTLFISLQTVKDHIHHIFIKTGVRNRVELTNLIRRSG
jgi:DNA-binding CsgD family transcriptional regulator